MALFPNPFNTLLGLQEALEAFRTSGWLQSSPSGAGSYPPINIFRKNDDFILIAELPGINKSELDLQVKGRPYDCPEPRWPSMLRTPVFIDGNGSLDASIARSHYRLKSIPRT